MTRKEIERLLVSWGWISLGDYTIVNGQYTVDLEMFHVKRGFMINHIHKGPKLWVAEEQVMNDIAVNFFLQYLSAIVSVSGDVECDIMSEK